MSPTCAWQDSGGALAYALCSQPVGERIRCSDHCDAGDQVWRERGTPTPPPPLVVGMQRCIASDREAVMQGWCHLT